MYFGSLPEEFLLVILDDEKGEFIIKRDLFIEIGLAGASLLELVIRGKLAIEDNHIVVVDETPLEESETILEEIFDEIKKEPENKTALSWIRRIMNFKPSLRKIYLEILQNKELIITEEKKIFWIFKTTKYFEKKPEYDEVIKQYVSEIVLGDRETDPRTLAFLSLLYATNATGTLFTEDELEEHIDDIRGMVGDEQIGKSITETINAIIDALMRNFIVSSPYPF